MTKPEAPSQSGHILAELSSSPGAPRRFRTHFGLVPLAAQAESAIAHPLLKPALPFPVPQETAQILLGSYQIGRTSDNSQHGDDYFPRQENHHRDATVGGQPGMLTSHS